MFTTFLSPPHGDRDPAVSPVSDVRAREVTPVTMLLQGSAAPYADLAGRRSCRSRDTSSL